MSRSPARAPITVDSIGCYVSSKINWLPVSLLRMDGGNAPIASEALERIGALYTIEAGICGQSPDARALARTERAKRLLNALKS